MVSVGRSLWRWLSIAAFAAAAMAAAVVSPSAHVSASGHAYLGSVHLVVGASGTLAGYQENGFGGLTAGRLPAALFVDDVSRRPDLVTVDSTSYELRFSYADTQESLFKTAAALRYLRVQVRAEDNAILGEANLWDSTPCAARTLCATLDGSLAGHDTKAVALDFFDAAREALGANPGSRQHVAFVAAEAGASATGFDSSNGKLVEGRFPENWFSGGTTQPVEGFVVKHGATGRVMEMAYDPSAAVGLWRSGPADYRRWRLILRDRTGEEVARVRMRDSLAGMSETERRCGDATAQRRLCLAYDAPDFDGAPYRGQVMMVHIEDVGIVSLVERAPGGAVGGQLILTVFGGVLAGVKARRMRSPVREVVILLFMAASSLILPLLDVGSIFWTGGILALAGLAAAALFFLRGNK